MHCVTVICLSLALSARGETGPKVSKKPVARNPKSLVAANATPKRRNVEMLTLGVNYIFPTLKFEHGIGRNWTVGITSLFLHSFSAQDKTLQGYGAAVGFDYYLKTRFRGGWAEIAPAINLLKSNASGLPTNKTTFSVLATIGWRWAWTSGLNLGTGFGMHYFFHSDADTPSDVSRLLPSFVLDIGYTF